MKRFGIFWAIVLLVTACSENKSTKPLDLMSTEVFTAVILDVQIAEGIETQRASGNRFADSQADEAYSDVFAKHGVSKDSFLKTYAWYRENPEQMEVIFETVLDSLSKLEAEIKQAFAEEQNQDRYSLDSARSNNEKSIRAKLGAQ